MSIVRKGWYYNRRAKNNSRQDKEEEEEGEGDEQEVGGGGERRRKRSGRQWYKDFPYQSIQGYTNQYQRLLTSGTDGKGNKTNSKGQTQTCGHPEVNM